MLRSEKWEVRSEKWEVNSEYTLRFSACISKCIRIGIKEWKPGVNKRKEREEYVFQLFPLLSNDHTIAIPWPSHWLHIEIGHGMVMVFQYSTSYNFVIPSWPYRDHSLYIIMGDDHGIGHGGVIKLKEVISDQNQWNKIHIFNSDMNYNRLQLRLGEVKIPIRKEQSRREADLIKKPKPARPRSRLRPKP